MPCERSGTGRVLPQAGERFSLYVPLSEFIQNVTATSVTAVPFSGLTWKRKLLAEVLSTSVSTSTPVAFLLSGFSDQFPITNRSPLTSSSKLAFPVQFHDITARLNSAVLYSRDENACSSLPLQITSRGEDTSSEAAISSMIETRRKHRSRRIAVSSRTEIGR